MKNGDTVQIRQFDGTDSWIYAKVIDSNIRLVEVRHPGNPADGKQLVMAPADIRTKADLQALIDACTPIVNAASPQHGLSDAQFRQLGALDGFWLQYLNLHEKQNSLKLKVNSAVVQHYQSMMKVLS